MTHKQAQTHSQWVSILSLPVTRRHFVSTIGFSLGGQTQLMLQGVRVGNLRHLAGSIRTGGPWEYWQGCCFVKLATAGIC